MPKYHESVWFNILFLKAQTFACEAKKKEKAGSRLKMTHVNVFVWTIF